MDLNSIIQKHQIQPGTTKVIDIRITSYNVCYTKLLRAGFLSPVGLKDIRIVLDTAIDDRTLYIAGANEPDMHYRNVLYRRDFDAVIDFDVDAVPAENRAVCQNGVFYGLDELEPPGMFKSVTGPAFRNKDLSCVITSYSIHYTKLYEYRYASVWAAGSGSGYIGSGTKF